MKRNSTCIANNDVYLAVIGFESYRQILFRAKENLMSNKVSHISKLSVFNKFILSAKKKIAALTDEVEFEKDQYLIKEGD